MAFSGNTSEVELASGARTATVTGSDHTNLKHRGLRVTIDVTLVPGSAPSTVPTLQCKDANGIYFTLLTGAAITATGTTVLTIYPGVTVAANVAVSTILGLTWRIVLTCGNANSATYSVAYELLL